MAASEFVKLTTVVESNEGIELDFALPLSIIWEQKITTRVYRSLLKTFISPNYLYHLGKNKNQIRCTEYMENFERIKGHDL